MKQVTQQQTTAVRTYRLMKLPKLLSNSVLLRETKSDQLKALSCLEKTKRVNENNNRNFNRET